MAYKLRLNVVCPSRDKKFLVIADEDWTLEDVKSCTEVIFSKLYPEEPSLTVSKLQNEFHFDLPLDYCAGDALVDSGLVFAIEDEVPVTPRNIAVSTATQKPENLLNKPKRLKKKHKPRRKKFLAKKKGKSRCMSSDKVTSTTGPTASQAQPDVHQDCNLLPQVVQRISSEDIEVDIETIEEEPAHDVDVIN
ncbi:uncharacterized protein LOC5508449 [Nematostella vectensis]|uniref:uncharacterized protein LOC5508449 n=1 Tax=Nematostella vectensis TaxID=45351 RepID=UPI0020777C84|nr:uncharacterized protein LOC5508449 [Nematostella vectensis]